MKKKYQYQEAKKRERIARARGYRALVNSGKTAAEIARAEGVSRQCIQALIKSIEGIK